MAARATAIGNSTARRESNGFGMMHSGRKTLDPPYAAATVSGAVVRATAAIACAHAIFISSLMVVAPTSRRRGR